MLTNRGYDERQNAMLDYSTWSSLLPTRKRLRSPVFVQAVGLHFQCQLEGPLTYLKSALAYFAVSTVPKPLNLWLGLHAPGLNKAAKYIPTQGREAVSLLNAGVLQELEKMSPGELTDGASKSMEWYSATDGAESFDGTHYSYQVLNSGPNLILTSHFS